MRAVGRFAILPVVLVCALAAGHSAAQRPSVTSLLDAYLAGRFAQVAGYLGEETDFDAILKELRREGPEWIVAGEPAARNRRVLAAATFALEAARAGEWHEWKLIQKQPPMCDAEGCIQVLNILYWKAPPQLIEWGCALLRRHDTPTPVERWWHLAAVAVAQRSEDPHFMVGDPNIGLGVEAGEIGNRQDEIKHLEHARSRFPKEMRFLLAEGIARDIVWQDDATQAYRALASDPDVGGEATMRFGAMRMRMNAGDEALESFERTERLTRDPYVIFLARYFRAQILEKKGDREDAEEAYRGAAAAVPNAQSATVALATLLFRDGKRSHAQQLVRDMLAAAPPPRDPWRAYRHADDRFWPQLVGRLRAEILK